ncbi:MAG: TRAP transporter substrate-binding protein [Tistlia sp.]|uniref:TRAP transporter substrate-binding protein n=1 Tax=Tistlia sp. TaxID=3057121 RepID=UPI0034A5C4A6
MNRTLITLSAASLLAAGLAAPAAAQDIQEVELSVVGSWSGLPLHKQFERPFWTETLPQASGGKITVNLTTFDQMGVKGGDVYRLLDEGVFDVGMTVADYTVADAPELEGLDVPLVATDPADARAMVEAARPMVEDIMRDRFGSKLLAIAPYPPQVVFCKPEIAGLKDLEGLKVRGSGRMTTKFLEALGASGVNVDFSEVPGALERGVIDCAITGSGSGYSAGWWESADYLMTLPLGGWDAVVTAMNLERWESLNAATQELIQSQIAEHFEAAAWDAAAGNLEVDIACLTGKGECPAGESAGMTLVEPSEADTETANRVLRETVLPEWKERAGAEWAQRWSDSVGAVVGVTID